MDGVGGGVGVLEGGVGGVGDVGRVGGVPGGEVGGGFDLEMGAEGAGVGGGDGPGDGAVLGGGEAGEGRAGFAEEVFDGVGDLVVVVVAGEGGAGGR